MLRSIGKQSTEFVESVWKKIRSSAIAKGPCDASCHLKSCHCHAAVQKLLVREVLNKSKL